MQFFRMAECIVVSAALLAGTVELQPASAQAVAHWNKPCKKAYADLKKRPKHKAFAISNIAVDNSGQTCGYAYGHGSKASAEKAALNFCYKGRYGNRVCRILASE